MQVGSEEWTFWQYNSIPNIPRIHYKLKARTRLLSPFFIRWQMNAYFAIKHDLETLGLGPFHCPTSVSSGMHAVYMAMAMCKRVSLFGYSYYDEMMTTRAGHNNGPQVRVNRRTRVPIKYIRGFCGPMYHYRYTTSNKDCVKPMG